MGQKIDQDATHGIKLLRIFRKLLLNGRRHYQSDLAREFQCSAQTIIRIMADIESVLGVNLESGMENRRKWYQLRSKNAPSGDFEEVRYLSVCRDLAEKDLPGPVLARVDDTLANLSAHLTAHHGARPDRPPAMHYFSKGRIDYTNRFSEIEALIEAIEKRRVCRITYRIHDGLEDYRFAPACIINMEGALFVAGALLEEERSMTNLEIHRIQKLEVSREHFDLEFPDLSANLFGLPWHEPRTFRILFRGGETAEYITERIWSDAQTVIQQPDGSLILEITTRSEDELRAWVRSFGSEARMLEN